MMNDVYGRVIKELKCIVTHDISRYKHAFGLCSLMEIAAGTDNIDEYVDVTEVTKTIMKAWPKYSGNPNYPIPCNLSKNPMVAYQNCKDLYDLTTEYGRLRIELAEYLIVELTKLIEKDYDNV